MVLLSHITPTVININTTENISITSEIETEILDVQTPFQLSLPNGYEDFEICSIKEFENWIYLTLIRKEENSINNEDYRITQFLIALAEFSFTTNEWTFYIENTNEYTAALQRLPSQLNWLKILDETRIKSYSTNAINIEYSIPGLPWLIDTSWRYNQGPAESDHLNEFDFGVPTIGVQDQVYAAESGNVVGTNGTCVWIQRPSDGLRLFYQHIEASDINNLSIGEFINYGDWLGRTTTSPGCGGKTENHHLHFSFYSPYSGGVINPQGFLMNGWLVEGNTLTKEGQVRTANLRDRVLHSRTSSSTCAAPSLIEPSDGAVLNNNTITFRWNAISGCTFNGYTFRVKDTSNMDSGGSTIVDTGVGDTSRTETIGAEWNNRDLYWGVRAANAPNGSNWAVRRFRIEPGGGSCDATNVPSGYTKCADENNRCNFSGTKSVYYGANSCYKVRSFSNGVDCNNDNFSDPVPGTQKACYVQQDTSNCPSLTNEVRGYDNTNCGGNYTYVNSTGLYTFVPAGFNDCIESIAISNGWSARLYKDDSESSPNACFGGNDGDLWNNTFSDGSTVANQATYMRVYDNSSCTSNTPPVSPSLNSPSNYAVVNRTDNITLSWNSASGATQYYAEFWGGPSISLNSGWTSNTSWSLGSQWGGVYQWHVKAKNSAGESGWSETRSLTIKLGAPNNLSASVISQTQINLSWNPSADGPGNIDGYRIYRNGSSIATVNYSATTYNNSGLDCATSYNYYVKAYKSSLESDSSNAISATTIACSNNPDSYEPDNTSIQAKMINSGSSQTHNIIPASDIDWVKFSISNESAIKLETSGSTSSDTRMWLFDSNLSEIEYDDDDGTNLYSLIQCSCDVNSLFPGTYYVKIDEFGNNSEIPNYQINFSVLETCSCHTPKSPDIYSPYDTLGTNDNTPTFYWENVTGATKYQIQVDNNSDFSSPVIDAILSNSSFTPSNALADGIYYWRVRSKFDQNGCNTNGEWSEEFSLVITTTPAFNTFSKWSNNTPIIDGQINSAEWQEANTYDIGLPQALLTNSLSKKHQMTDFNLPEIKGFQKLPSELLNLFIDNWSPVTLYLENNSNYLYLAIDNPNDVISDTYDQVGIYFDDNPLPSDGQWTNSNCGNSDGEGNFWIRNNLTEYREIISGPSGCGIISPVPGLTGNLSYSSGHIQAEVAIDLTTSAMRAKPGQALGINLWIFDDNTYTYQGHWPLTGYYLDPATYRHLFLAFPPGVEKRIFLPITIRK